MTEPSLLDRLRGVLTLRRVLRASLVAAALASLVVAGRLFASPDAPLARPLAWMAVAIALGEAARAAGRSGGGEPSAITTPERPGDRPSARALALLCVVVLGAGFRFAWARWDEGAHLHPDEYGLTATLTRLSFPRTPVEWFDTRLSPMSPYGKYDVDGRRLPGKAPDEAMRWGQWPQLLVRGAAEILGSNPKEGGRVFTGFAELRLLGRRLSALASALTLVALFFLARRLFGPSTALLTTALAALAPLPLQQARFLTVDGFAALFATAALLPAVRLVTPRPGERGSHGASALFGLLSAMAVASRLNLAPIVLLLPVALALRERGAPLRELLRRAAGPALLGAVVFLATFRVTHPMAFRASIGETSLLTVSLNPDWIRNVALARAESALESTSPPAEQWTGRTRVLFPALNTFLWGLGIPGGLLALAGIVLAAKRTARARPGPLILLAFTVGFFLFMAARPVSSIRYFLPVYPLFALFGALALERLEEAFRGRWPRLSRAIPAVAVLAALGWGWAFTGVWRNPNTRIVASRYLYGNLPAAVNVVTDTGKGERRIPLRTERAFTVSESPAVLGLPAGTGGSLHRVELAHLSGAPGSGLSVAVRESGGADSLVEMSHVLPGEGRHPLGDPASLVLGPARLDPARRYELVLTAGGGPVSLRSSVLLGEVWDEVLPCALDGLDGGLYDGRLLPVRGPDDARKRAAILEALLEADAVVLSSPRSLWVVPRLPTNYPFTSAYYRALFDGRLGFAPAPRSPFQAPLRFGPLAVSDAAGTMAWGRPPTLPVAGGGAFAAEEAFFVYDHAPVWVFHRVAHVTQAELDEILPASLLDDVLPLSPREAGTGRTDAPSPAVASRDRVR